MYVCKVVGTASSEGCLVLSVVAAYLAPRSGEPAPTTRYGVPARLLGLGSGDLVTTLRLRRAVDQATMYSFAARTGTLHANTSISQSKQNCTAP